MGPRPGGIPLCGMGPVPLDGHSPVVLAAGCIPLRCRTAVSPVSRRQLLTVSEVALLNNMSVTCIQLGMATKRLVWFDHAIQCAEAVINMRYTTHNVLSKAYSRAAEARSWVRYLHKLPLVPEMDPEDSLKTMVGKQTYLATLIRLWDSQDGWAHAKCHTSHEGCVLQTHIDTNADCITRKGPWVAV